MKAKQHYYYQRLSAVFISIFLIALIFIFPLFVTTYSIKINIAYLLIGITLAIGIWHGLLGIQTICEDYISNIKLRNTTITAINAIVYVSLFIGIIIQVISFVISLMK
ncbi:MAG: succinate dehydrogenase, hydrophobic membrane anchor protein [Rickettsiaceae bacterium H1]|nr:succinate dehydrogenase, hydrophobic membrane anchor protein [Rickettsiaceae bacterium H1]